MISLKSALAFVLLLAASSTNVSAFDTDVCDVYVFRTSENALWHCGPRLPAEPTNEWTSLYCDHDVGELVNYLPFVWAADYPDDWCKFMIATVREGNQDHYNLTPEIGINETPGPNKWTFETIVDWGCYSVENQVTTAAYIVDSRNGEHATDVTEQCTRTKNYFDYWNLDASFRDGTWWGEIPAFGTSLPSNRCPYISVLEWNIRCGIRSCPFFIPSNNHPLFRINQSIVLFRFMHTRTQTIIPTATLGSDATTMTPKMPLITFQNSMWGTPNATLVITANKK